MINDLIKSMRYRGWSKNLLVFGALFFVPHALSQSTAVSRAVLSFIAFCFLASSLYIVNDVKDAKRDKLHPRKKDRPIASGRLPVSTALFFSFILLLIAFCIAVWLDISAFQIQSFSRIRHINFGVTLTFFAYFILTMLYTFFLKRISILDVIIIAIGFVLRTVAGAAALNVEISQWLLMCTFLLSVYLALGKRRAEIIELGMESANHRENLSEYSVPLIDQLLSITAATSIISYSLYTALAETAPRAMMITIPIVIFGIFRYQALVQIKDQGANPEEILLKDRPLQIDILIWLITVMLVFKFS